MTVEEIFQNFYKYWPLILTVGVVAAFFLVKKYRSEFLRRATHPELTESQERDEGKKDLSRDLTLVTGPDGHDYIIYADSEWEQGGIAHAGGCRACKQS